MICFLPSYLILLSSVLKHIVAEAIEHGFPIDFNYSPLSLKIVFKTSSFLSPGFTKNLRHLSNLDVSFNFTFSGLIFRCHWFFHFFGKLAAKKDLAFLLGFDGLPFPFECFEGPVTEGKKIGIFFKFFWEIFFSFHVLRAIHVQDAGELLILTKSKVQLCIFQMGVKFFQQFFWISFPLKIDSLSLKPVFKFCLLL